MAIRVLVVDDALFMRELLKGILKKHGFEVCGEASNGKEAYQKYKELMPDIVTMDITMPVVNGIEGTRMIISEFPRAKIIICSAMGQNAMVLESIKAGASNFIVKPFQHDKVISTIKEVYDK